MPGPDKKTNKNNTDERPSLRELESRMAAILAEREERFEKEKKLPLFNEKLNKPSNSEHGDTIRITDKIYLNTLAKELQQKYFSGKPEVPYDNSPNKEVRVASLKRLIKELKQGEQTNFSEQLPEGTDLLELILRDVRFYANIDHTANNIGNQSEDEKKLEGRLAMRIMRRLDILSENMEKENEEINRYNAKVHEEYQQKLEETEGKRKTAEELKTDPEFQKLLKDHADDERFFALYSLKGFFEARLYGKLGLVPEEPVEPDAHHLIVTNSYVGNDRAEKSALKTANEKNTTIDLEKDLRKAPLFPHTPSPQDVQQFLIGDCFLLATLSEIAAKHPEKIEEMIRDNHDGTATVRFYHRTQNGDGPDAFSPFYVTVDKVANLGQARDSLWVQTIERAYTVSGLLESQYDLRNKSVGGVKPNVQDQTNDYDAPHPWGTYGRVRPNGWVPSFNIVDGSSSGIAMYTLLGNDAAIKDKEISAGMFDNGNGPSSEADLPEIPVSRSVKSKEMKYVKTIKKAIKAGGLACAGSCIGNGDDSKEVAGIYKNHAYSVLGVVEKKIGQTTHYFVKLRNPHGGKGRDYQKTTNERGETILKPTTKGGGIFSKDEITDGTCYVEIRHFKHEFKNLHIADVKDSSLAKADKLAVQEFQMMVAYRDSFKEIYDYLDDKVSSLRGSSKEYDALKAALKKAFKKPASNYVELEKHINKLSKTMVDYLEHASLTTGDEELRLHKKNACNALSTVLRAADIGFMAPKEYAKEELADKLLTDFQNQHMKDKVIKPEVKTALDLIQNDRTAARGNVMKSDVFETIGSSSNMVKLGHCIYSQSALLKNISSEMIAPQKMNYVVKTTDDLRAQNNNQGPVMAP